MMTNNAFPSSAQINFQVTERQKHARANLTIYAKAWNKTTLLGNRGLHTWSISYWGVIKYFLWYCCRCWDANDAYAMLILEHNFCNSLSLFTALQHFFWSHMLKFTLTSLHCCSEFYLLRFTLIFYISFSNTYHEYNILQWIDKVE